MIELPLALLARAKRLAQLAHVGVRVAHLALRLREPHCVDDRRVVQLVADDHRVLVGERRDRRLVRVPARHVRERRVRRRELREIALELEMRLERPADEAHRRGAGAVALEPLDAGAHDVRMVGEAEVVVRREDDHLAAPAHAHDRALRRLERVEALVRPRLAQRVELRADLLLQVRHAAASATARSGAARSCRPRRSRASRRRAGSSARPSSAVMSGRRSTTPCSSSHRVRYHVSQTWRPLTAETSRFLKMSASATSSFDRLRRDAEEDHAAAVAGDLERVGDRLRRARHLEDDVDVLALVLLHEPGGDIVDGACVQRRGRPHRARRGRAGTACGRMRGRARRPTRARCRC